MKIGPVNPDNLVQVKKEEITEGKIYSPVGKFAERAKKSVMYRIDGIASLMMLCLAILMKHQIVTDRG